MATHLAWKDRWTPQFAGSVLDDGGHVHDRDYASGPVDAGGCENVGGQQVPMPPPAPHPMHQRPSQRGRSFRYRPD
jgi:hypothetical protein